MAKAKTYPKISRKIWWLLRDRLKKSMPSAISTTYIVALNEMTPDSARANVLGPLRELGLIDETNKPTALAERWRHDDEYNSVCHEIRQAVYPHELVEAFDNPDSNQRDAIKSWFMKSGQVGESAARMYTDTFLLLSEADVTKANDKAATPSANRQTRQPKSAAKPQARENRRHVENAQTGGVTQNDETHEEHGARSHRRLPAIHIDVQVHISPETSAEQIDRIFESMAKHLGAYIK